MGAREMKDTKNILILGGYGNTGLAIARLLLRDSDHNICLAGREQMKADREARVLNWEHSCDRVRGVQVNLGLKRQLIGIMEGYDLVIDNIEETAFNGQAARTALDSGTTYLALTSDKDKLLALKGIDVEIQAEGLTFITNAGIVPGASFLMARYLSGFFDVLDTVTIGGLPGEETHSYRSVGGLIPTPGNSPFIFGDGSEVKKPIDSIFRRLRARWFRRFTRDCDGIPDHRQGLGVKATAKGVMNGREEQLRLTLEHRDPYRAAAIATVPCILGLVDGSIKQPGVHMMGHVLDAELYMENLWNMGMKVSLQGLPETWHEEYMANEIRLVDQVA
jgi:hypothetical protein